jgi:hypothetical protein
LGFALDSAVDKVDLPEGRGRVFVKHVPEVSLFANEFAIIKNSGDGDFGITVTPAAEMAAGYKKADNIQKLAQLAVEAGLATPFVPRGFHAMVQESLTELLNTPYGECPYGVYVTLEDESIVLVVSEIPLSSGTLVEAVQARNNVLVVQPATFEVAEPYTNETWVDFLEDLLAEEKRRYRGRLTPRSAPKKIRGIWVGPALDYVNKRGQASCKIVIDGSTEGSIADLYFTRVTEPKKEVICTGDKVSVWYSGGANVAVVPYDGKVDRIIDPETIAGELGIRLPGRTLESNGSVRVTRR